ncbi:MAG: L-threonylcarbamoyladenylate synthase [Verrucomicrobiota bacterium]
MRRLQGSDAADRSEAIQILRSGGLVAVPTETVYGLAADATNSSAVSTIFEAKGRPQNDPLIVHIADRGQAEQVCHLPVIARLLMETFWPGPLTIVLPRLSSRMIPTLVSSGHPTLALRMPGHPSLRSLLEEGQLFLAAPSANPFGYISPTRPEHVEQTMGDRIDALLDGGPCQHGIESTIVQVDDREEVTILRPGPITQADLAKFAPNVKLYNDSRDGESDARRAHPAPGMMKSHYRPSKGLILFPENSDPPSGDPQTAFVYLRKPPEFTDLAFWLSEDGSGREIAHNLFHTLRKIDNDPRVRKIAVEFPSGNEGVLSAVRDRLQRAAAPLG